MVTVEGFFRKLGLWRRGRSRFVAVSVRVCLARVVRRHDPGGLVSRSLLQLFFFFLLFGQLFLTLLESVVGCRQGSSLNQVLTQYRNLNPVANSGRGREVISSLTLRLDVGGNLNRFDAISDRIFHAKSANFGALTE